MTCQCSGGMLLKSTSAERECKENTEYEDRGEEKNWDCIET
jgi:hypothetical protein